MKRILWLAALAAMLMGPVVFAEEGGAAEKGTPPAEGTAPAEDKAPAKDDSIDMSEDVVFERLTGLYFEGRGGMFFTLAGARGYSNGQPFFGFEIGYDITDALSIQLGYSQGYQAANPLMYVENCTAGAECSEYHLDYGMTFFNLSADYDMVSGRRWALEVRLGGGVVLIDPSAEPGQGVIDGDVFGGLRFEYYTLLKHFTLGAEVDFFYVLPTGIPALAVSLSVLYNF